MPGQAFQQWDFATILTGDQMGAFFTILNHGIFTDHGDKLTCGFIQPLEPKRRPAEDQRSNQMVDI